MKRVLLPVSLMLSGLLVILMALGMGSSRTASAEESTLEKGVTATVQAAVAAYNRGDLPALARLFTDDAFQQEFFVTKSEAAADPEFFGDPAIVRAIRNIMETETGASATVEFEGGLGIQAELLSFVFQGGIWIIDGSQPGSAEVPEGATVVDLTLQEFAFVFDKDAVASGNFSFSATNAGQQEHEIAIIQLAAAVSTADLISAFENEDDSQFLDFGFLGIVPPGASSVASLSHPLEDGYYALVCFLPDTDGVPHAFKGMVGEFTVGSPAAGSISPPNTGDAGLAKAGDGLNIGLMAFGVMVIVVGLATGLRARRS